ncbi:hypothetical protein MRY87_06045, partial [bacterium]|nr:hypothetical protein [bacterium]
IGGASFFFSYLVLLGLVPMHIGLLYAVIVEAPLASVALFFIGLILGWWAAYTFFRGQTSVLIHEYKHAILSTLMGNRWKGISLKGMSGTFRYSYTKETARYNAFISLAPYFLPIFTFTGIILFLLISYRSPEGALVVAGLLHGADLYFHLKDVSPIQTDLTDLVGGYWVGVGYIASANIFVSTLFFVWAVGGSEGLSLYADSLWKMGEYLVALVRAVVIP